MAIVKDIERGDDCNKLPHPTVVRRCVAFIVEGSDGERYIEMNTYGSADRMTPQQPSQMTQFNEQAARQLKELIEEAFPNLK
jgi:hypothetical protein